MTHATAYADLTTSERLQYADWNSSYDTFRIAPPSTDPVNISAYELFNIAYSATGQSVPTYTNTADFYADRAVKSLVSNWTVSEGSQIIGEYRSTSGHHYLDLTNSTGTAWNIIARPWDQYDSRETWIDSLDSSRNIDVGAIDDAVNMNLLHRDRLSGVYGDQPELNGGVINMVAYDVTDLLKAMGYTDIENAFMFAWEDYNWAIQGAKDRMDFDYNDMVYIMTNVTPNATPEPATMLIFGLGIAGVAAARRMKRK